MSKLFFLNYKSRRAGRMAQLHKEQAEAAERKAERRRMSRELGIPPAVVGRDVAHVAAIYERMDRLEHRLDHMATDYRYEREHHDKHARIIGTIYKILILMGMLMGALHGPSIIGYIQKYGQ